MALERFMHRELSRNIERVAIWSKGQIGLNKSLVVKYGLLQFKKVIMFFDPANSRIVLQFTTDMNVEGAFNVNYGKSLIGLIAAKTYLDYFNISHATSMRYPAHYDEVTNTLTLIPAEGVPAASRKPKEAKPVQPVVDGVA